MNKQLLIIGNGFDLHCGLKSSFYDFYLAEIKDKFRDFNKRQPENFWHILLTEYESISKDYNWCDIEKIIMGTLLSIDVNDSTNNQNVQDLGFYKTALDLVISNYEKGIYAIWSPTSTDKIGDFVLQYCYYYIYSKPRSSFVSITTQLDHATSVCKEAFYKHLLQELKKLERLFCEYLKKQLDSSPKYFEKATDTLISISSLNEFSSDTVLSREHMLSQCDFSNICLLSFNYTLPFAEVKVRSYSNVHGKLCSNSCDICTSSTTIFGIDDKLVSEKENSNLRVFSKTYRTLFSSEESQNILPLCCEPQPLTIKFFGHSLAEADYSYFQSIFDYYHIYDNQYLSLEFFYTPYKDGIKNTVADSVYKLINEYGLTLNNKNQGINLMHKLILEKRIKIKEIPC